MLEQMTDMDFFGIQWEACRDDKGWQVQPYEKGVHTVALILIDEDEQKTINRYDAVRYQKPDDKVVFYVCWADGEWQPRSTHPDFESARQKADEFWLELINA